MSEATLHRRLGLLGLHGAADILDDIIALATKKRWGGPDETNDQGGGGLSRAAERR